MATYKRGTIIKDGKRYGYYPDGSLYRIYPTADTPWMQFVDVDGETKLRVRQATELGYAECPVNGCVDLAYPSSTIRRARTVGGGQTRQCPYLRSATTCISGIMKHLIPFVKRFKTLCPRTDGFSTALSARYDGWGGLYDNHGQHTMILIVYE